MRPLIRGILLWNVPLQERRNICQLFIFILLFVIIVFVLFLQYFGKVLASVSANVIWVIACCLIDLHMPISLKQQMCHWSFSQGKAHSWDFSQGHNHTVSINNLIFGQFTLFWIAQWYVARVWYCNSCWLILFFHHSVIVIIILIIFFKR